MTKSVVCSPFCSALSTLSFDNAAQHIQKSSVREKKKKKHKFPYVTSPIRLDRLQIETNVIVLDKGPSKTKGDHPNTYPLGQ